MSDCFEIDSPPPQEEGVGGGGASVNHPWPLLIKEGTRSIFMVSGWPSADGHANRMSDQLVASRATFKGGANSLAICMVVARFMSETTNPK